MGKGGGRILACITVVLFYFTGTAAADLNELYVRPQIIPAGENVSMNDVFIAVLSDNTQFTLSSQDSTVFGERPAVIPLWQISGVLQTEHAQGIDESAVSLVGRRAVYIPSRIESPAMIEMLTQILPQLAEKYESSEERIEIEIPYLPASLQALARDDADKSISESKGLELSSELLTIRGMGQGKSTARFLVKKGTMQGVVTASIERFTPYLKAQRRIKDGEAITVDDVQRSTVRVGAYPEALTLTQGNSDFEARTEIFAGEPLHIRNARIKPLVVPGDRVSVMMQRGAVQLRIAGNARGAAGRNESVAVKLDTGVIKECRVVRAGEVVFE
ncbi:MAG: flagellar basal body P-ring formation chaperone FlgA [Spirochaetaceae bacterium]|nr:flagellar basal body P-ring formation chaperone FlgA [Spirochaetaceae bacterium]MCF7948546.1 flagellar basal body P-ring formation chaperone FlgA [Spirochaetia bacterium]MCF7951871.1 flagellar basal body P-ring formation chaperone FlgA [Spirochaetaceae bacterium]